VIHYLRETWDLHAGAMVAFALIAIIMLWLGVFSWVWWVPVIAVGGATLFVLGLLWVLALFGVSLPW
jgi:hypothetical protein